MNLLPGHSTGLSRISIRLYSALFILVSILTANSVSAQNNAVDYRVHYRSTARMMTPHQGITTRDNGTFLVGRWGWSDDSSHLLVIKTDRLGRVVFRKYVPINTRIDNYNLIETADGGVVFAGNSRLTRAPYYFSTFLFKFGCNGQILWSKILNTPTNSPETAYRAAFHLKEGKNNDVLLTTVNQSSQSNGQYSMLSRIDVNGNIVWTKSFVGTDQTPTSYPLISFLSGNKVLAFAFRDFAANSNFYPTQRYIACMQINYETGELERSQGYFYNEAATSTFLGSSDKFHFYGEQLNTGQIVLFGGMNYTDRNLYFFKLIINPDFSIASSSRWGFPWTTFYYATRFSVFPNGQFHLSGLSEGARAVYYFAGDASHKVLRSIKRFSDATGFEYPQSSFARGAEGFTYLAQKGDPPAQIEALTMEQSIADTMGCLKGQDTALGTLFPGWAPVNFAWPFWKEFRSNELAATAVAFESLDIPLEVNFLCSGSPITSTTSPILACNLVLPVKLHSFTAERVRSGTRIKWATEEQSDVRQYTLQSSGDGIHFTDIHSKHLQAGTGNFSYDFMDLKEYSTPAIFYRLMTTYTAGNNELSKVISVKWNGKVIQLSFYPSPVTTNLSMNTNLKIDKLEFFNASGERVKVVNRVITNQPIPVNDLVPGLYIVKAWSGKEIILRKVIRN